MRELLCHRACHGAETDPGSIWFWAETLILAHRQVSLNEHGRMSLILTGFFTETVS